MKFNFVKRLLNVLFLLAAVEGRNVINKAAAGNSAAAQESPATSTVHKCLAGGQSTEVCSLNPAIAFSTSLGSDSSLSDRLYRQYMAQHVLCPTYSSERNCINKTGPVTCAWSPRRQRCEADKYASFLMPMTCPGSAARAYLTCMRKPSAAACKADDACTEEHADACLPSAMVAQARIYNSSVQAMAERLALGVLQGSASAVGDCAEARTLQRMAELCPYKNPWNRCNHKYCTYDVPPYLPRRPQGRGQPAAPAAAAGTEVLTYYGHNPGPLCAVDTDKLPAVLHEILDVSKGLAGVVAEAQRECKAAETVSFNVTTNVAACGYETVQYDAAHVLQAAGIVQQQQKAAAKAAAGAQRPGVHKASGGILTVRLPGATLTLSSILQ
ncbi:hypothetical protein COO60DRAFT_1476463 [Scenedesmus sp. NREL 46B-D3]|nr:hypothetical protein COO60DRAFT_1476463 [Scenedesmus sp. NREL 46B-D3]